MQASGGRCGGVVRVLLLASMLLAAGTVGARPVPGDVPRVQSVPGTPADPSQRVRVAPRFAAGDVLYLAFRKTARLSAPGVPDSTQAQSGEATLRVLANDSRGTRLECVYGAFRLDAASDPAVRDNPLLEVMLGSRDGTRLVIAAGPGFTNPRVENVDEVLSRFAGTLDRALATLPPEVATPVEKMLRQAMADRDGFALKLAEDLFVFLAPLGADLPRDGAVSGATEIRMLAGNAPVKAWTRMQVVALDRGAQRARLEYHESTNKDDLQRASAGLFDRIRASTPAVAGADAAAPVAAAAAPHFEEWSTQDVDLASGWPRQSRRERLLEAGGQRSVEQVIVERMP